MSDEFFAVAVASPVSDLVRSLNIGCVIVDFSPLREQTSWISQLTERLPKDVPCYQVDAHNVIPVWITSSAQEYSARTIRPKIHSRLLSMLTEFPPLVGKHANCNRDLGKPIDWKEVKSSFTADRSVEPVNWAKGGTKAGLRMLLDFIDNRLPVYDKLRNDPTKAAVSSLSPWLHFGQVAPQRAILEVKAISSHRSAADAFIEEILVRRELADNFCFYNPLYDKIEGAPRWAQETLLLHANDERKPAYNNAQFETAQTHDQLWNASQRQLIQTGKMHPFLRMYWAKKILEWHQDGPGAALRLALHLNDRYNLDGSDPNGVVGVMWSICGVHDQGWAERPIFGKIRCMTYKGCQSKFSVSTFEQSYPP